MHPAIQSGDSSLIRRQYSTHLLNVRDLEMKIWLNLYRHVTPDSPCVRLR